MLDFEAIRRDRPKALSHADVIETHDLASFSTDSHWKPFGGEPQIVECVGGPTYYRYQQGKVVSYLRDDVLLKRLEGI